MKRGKGRKKFDPADVICHWCRQPAPNSEWRSIIRDIDEDATAFGPHSGWTICGPDCPERPDSSLPFRRRPPIAVWLRMSRDEQNQYTGLG